MLHARCDGMGRQWLRLKRELLICYTKVEKARSVLAAVENAIPVSWQNSSSRDDCKDTVQTRAGRHHCGRKSLAVMAASCLALCHHGPATTGDSHVAADSSR